MENQFYIKPLGGMDVGNRLTQVLEGGRQQKRIMDMQKLAPEVIKSGDPGKIAEFMIAYPEMANVTGKVLGTKNELVKQKVVDLAKNVLMENADPVSSIAAYAEILKQNNEDPKLAVQSLQKALASPDHGKKWAENMLAFSAPEEYKTWIEANASVSPDMTSTQKEYLQARQQGFEGSLIDYKKEISGNSLNDLTGSQKDYALAKNEGFSGSFVDFKRAISGNDTGLKTMMLQTQILDIQDRISSRQEEKVRKIQAEELEVDKDRKIEETKAEKERKRISTLTTSMDTVMGNVQEAISIAEGSYTSTGLTGAATANIPGSPSYNLRKKIGVIKANIGFDKLQQMRDFSQTGGALGQVAVQELDALQNSIDVLDPNMGDKELISALNKVYGHYERSKIMMKGISNKLPGNENQDTSKYKEGQTATGPNGEKVIYTGGKWEKM